MTHQQPGSNKKGRGNKGTPGFTLFEMIIVIALILFLTRLTFFQFTSTPHEVKLDGAAKALGFYFNSASQAASATQNWTLVVANVDPNTEGYLRQFATFTWFRGNEPFEDGDGDGIYKDGDDYLDINGDGSYSEMATGWRVVDAKGYWLPDKIYFDVERSGAATFTGKGFSPVRKYSSSDKFHYFALEHEKKVGPTPEEATDVSRIPFFLDRSGFRAKKGSSNGYGFLASAQNPPTSTDPDEIQVYEYELDFSKSKRPDKWIYFLFDPQGKYINIESERLRGAVNEQAQRDFIVLGLGVLNFQGNPDEKHIIRPLSGKTETMRSAFVIHRTGTYSMIEDETQIPKP